MQKLSSGNLAYPILAQRCISYGNQSFDLNCKSNDWFLYEMQHWAEMGKVLFQWFVSSNLLEAKFGDGP